MKKSTLIALVFFGTVFVADPVAAQSFAVTTYHYDNLRTGWNNNETTLTATSFAGIPGKFGILKTVVLDDQVDAQPLLVPGLTIAGGTHDVVYVATESNTIYAIDASSAFSKHPLDLPFRCRFDVPIMGRMWESTAPPSSI